jgi:hypothetical protein
MQRLSSTVCGGGLVTPLKRPSLGGPLCKERMSGLSREVERFSSTAPPLTGGASGAGDG